MCFVSQLHEHVTQACGPAQIQHALSTTRGDQVILSSSKVCWNNWSCNLFYIILSFIHLISCCSLFCFHQSLLSLLSLLSTLLLELFLQIFLLLLLQKSLSWLLLLFHCSHCHLVLEHCNVLS
ncbi:hypothetical protein C8J56DRAFT_940426 [Mycena floridula]|nr:hypothetical protein C8J56DRAFT_940426 [Mycena floridula]